MDHEKLYHAIFHRMSVRKYDSFALDEEERGRIVKIAEDATPLCPEIKTEVRILDSSQLYTYAPQCLCFYAEKSERSLLNAGYLSAKMDLYFSASNIGSCYIGLAKHDKEKALVPGGMELMTILAFGTPAEPMHRASAADFKRKTLNEISPVTDLYNLLEAVRLAPSSLNKQPWYFAGDAANVVASMKKAIPLERLYKISMGIALCYFELAAEHFHKKASFSFVPKEVPKKHVFTADITLENKE